MRHGFVHDVNHAGARDEAKTGDTGLFLCVQIRAFTCSLWPKPAVASQWRTEAILVWAIGPREKKVARFAGCSGLGITVPPIMLP
jgi:hypothetical protein